jgi:hypothetical protein
VEVEAEDEDLFVRLVMVVAVVAVDAVLDDELRESDESLDDVEGSSLSLLDSLSDFLLFDEASENRLDFFAFLVSMVSEGSNCAVILYFYVNDRVKETKSGRREPNREDILTMLNCDNFTKLFQLFK